MIQIFPIVHDLHPRHVFRLAHATRPLVRNVFLIVEQNGLRGYGEASPSAFYGEEANEIYMRLCGLQDYFKQQTINHREDISRIWNEVWPMVAPSRATQCAIDIALWDLWGKLRDKSVARLIWGEAAKPFTTSCTLGLSEKSELAEKFAELKDFPAIKVKMDAAHDINALQAIAAMGSAHIRLDANGSWLSGSTEDWTQKIQALAPFKIELLEQPLLPQFDAEMPTLKKYAPFPIFADESCIVEEDVEKLVGHFDGLVLKLVKCGGITPALRLLNAAQRLHLKVMVGCMLESSVLIAAGSVLAQKAEYADLDGAWLLKDDPFTGLNFKQGLLIPNDDPGLGVRPLPEYALL